MKLFTKDDLINLTDNRDTPCVSIFIPTERAGQDAGPQGRFGRVRPETRPRQGRLRHGGGTGEEDADGTPWTNQSVGLTKPAWAGLPDRSSARYIPRFLGRSSVVVAADDVPLLSRVEWKKTMVYTLGI